MSRKLTLESAELLANKFKADKGIGLYDPLSMKTVIRRLKIHTVYRPLSEKLFGLSLMSKDREERFLLVNSNTTRGRQHFTIAHELYHLFYDENPQPHFCGYDGSKDAVEKSADLFASAFLVPKEGLLREIREIDLKSKKVDLDTVIRLEQLFGVSHSTMVFRLKDLKIISSDQAEELLDVSIRCEAVLRGIDCSLYSKGNDNLIISDFGIIARQLFEDERISEGHYMELLNIVGYAENEDCSGC